MVSNFLPPDSQPWARSLESRLSSLESTTSSLKKSTTSRLSSAVSTPDNRLTLSTPPVPGEGALNGSLEHLNGVYTLRYGHEFHGLTQYYLEIKGEYTGGGPLVVTGPNGVVLHETELEADEDPVNFTVLVEFPISTHNYDLDVDEDTDLPEESQDVVSEFVLPDTGTITLATPATLSNLSFEIRSLNRSQIVIDTSSGQPEITGVSAHGEETRVLESFSTVLDEAIETINTARQELSDADDILASNLTDLETRLSDDIAEATVAIGGKNSVTISAHAPGTPGTSEGDVWWRIDTYDQVYGQWTWTGSYWGPSTIRNELVASLDVHKLQVTGDAKIAEAVINKLYSELIVAKLLTAERVIAEHMLATGSVTARTLNVVPEDGQGGTVLTGTQIGMVNSDGTGMMDLSVDSDNYMSFYRDEAVNFSVSADGALTAQDVSVNNSLIYRGEELSGLIDPRPKGMIARSMLKNRVVSGGPWTELCSVTFTPEPGRLYRASVSVTVTSSAYVKGYVGIKFSTLSAFSRTWALPEYTANFSGSSTFEETFTAKDVASGEQEVTLSLYGMSSSAPSQIAFEGWDTSGTGKRSCYMTVEDLGAPVPWTLQTMESQRGEFVYTPVKTEKPASWGTSGFQNYLSGARVNHASGKLAGGYYGGEWRGLVLFPDAQIRAFLAGAEITGCSVYLKNAHTYASSGSTVLIGSHNYATAPSSSPAVAAHASQHFSRGQGRWVPLPTAVGTGFANGTIKGIAVYGSSTANYALFDPSSVRIKFTYIK